MNWLEIQSWFWANWAGVFIGFAISFLFYWLGKKERKPKFAVRSYTVIQKAKEMTPGLTVHFGGHGEDLSNFTISRIAIWNRGKETIRRDDVPRLDPLRVLALEETKLLSAEVIYSSNVANQFSCSINKDKTVLNVSFEYFEWNEGMVIQVAHSGIGSHSLDVKGKIKGAGEIRVAHSIGIDRSIFRRVFMTMTRRRSFSWIMLSTGIFLFAMSFIVNPLLRSWTKESHELNSRVLEYSYFATGCPYLVLGILGLRRVMPRAIERVMDQPWG